MKRILFLFIFLQVFIGIYADTTLLPFGYNGKYGFIDQNLNIAIPPEYLEVTIFYNGKSIVKTDEHKFAIIDYNGNILKILNVRNAYGISDGIIRFRRDSVFGYFDIYGNEILYGFNYADDFSEGKALVRVNNKRYYIDESGKSLFLNLDIYAGSSFTNGIALVWKKKKLCGYIDESGVYIIEPVFDHLGNFSEGLCLATIDGKKGYINIEGNFQIEPKYFGGYAFYNGVTCVQYQKSEYKNPYYPFWQIIDSNDNIIKRLDERIVVLSDFVEGYAIIGYSENELEELKYGFLDVKGEFLVSPVFSNVSAFYSGFAKVSYNGKEGFIDKSGRLTYIEDIMNQNG